MRTDEAPTLLLTDEDYFAYHGALALLSKEPELEHLAASDIDTQLWNWVCELFVNKAEFRTERECKQAVGELLKKLTKPWQEYEVLVTIDHLTLRVRKLEVAGVYFHHLTAKAAAEWGLTGSSPMDELLEDVVGRCVAFTKVKAGSEQRATEKACLKVEDALDTLRAALTTSIRVRFSPQDLPFKRGQQLAVKPVTRNEVTSLRWERTHAPGTVQMTRRMAEPARKHLALINRFLDDQTIPEKLQSRVQRALRWIGQSIIKESADDRVVSLCTALETLLTTRNDGRKGEAIALRTMLLGEALQEGFLNPAMVYGLYEIRSEIIHGSAVRVGTDRHSDQLLWLANEMTTYFVRLVTENPSITRHSKLIAFLQEEHRLRAALKWLESSTDPNVKKIAAFASELLE